MVFALPVLMQYPPPVALRTPVGMQTNDYKYDCVFENDVLKRIEADEQAENLKPQTSLTFEQLTAKRREKLQPQEQQPHNQKARSLSSSSTPLNNEESNLVNLQMPSNAPARVRRTLSTMLNTINMSGTHNLSSSLQPPPKQQQEPPKQQEPAAELPNFKSEAEMLAYFSALEKGYSSSVSLYAAQLHAGNIGNVLDCCGIHVQLQDMGFPEDRIRTALIKFRDINLMLDFLNN